MILPDLNLLIFAYNTGAPGHLKAKAWWEACLSEDSRPVALPWVVLLGFLRIMTNRRVLLAPMTPTEALGHIHSWLDRPQTSILHPGTRHLGILEGLLGHTGTAGNLTTDAHLAALAIENGAELFSNDSDFSGFPGLRWTDPMA